MLFCVNFDNILSAGTMAQPALNQAELAKALRKLKTTSRPPTVITESKPMVKQLPPKSNKPQIAKNVKRYPECVQANAKHVSPAVKPFTNRPSKPSLPARKTAEPNPPATSHASDGDQRKTMPSKETSTCPIISERPLSSNKPDLPLKPVTQKTILDKPRGIGRRPLPPTPTYGTTAANSDRAPNPEDRCQDITATNEHSGYVGVNSRCSVNGQPGTQSASELQHTCQPGAQSEPHLQHTCARLMFSDGTTMLLSELPRSFVLDGVTHVKQPLMLSSLPPLPNLYRPSFVYLNTAPGKLINKTLYILT